MIYDYEVQPHEDAPDAVDQNLDTEFFNAKAFLQTASTNTGDNMYDHLTDVLNKILAERPENVIDFFEEYSRKVKEKRFRPGTDHLEDMYVPPGQYAVASNIMPLLKPLAPREPSTQDPEDLEMPDMTRNNTLELLYYLEQAGLGLPRQEMVFIMLSMRKLIHSQPIASIKFWGKILGTLHNYLILETELKEEEYMERNKAFEEEPKVEAIEPPPTDFPQEDEQSVRKALAEISKRQEMLGEGSKYPRPLPPEPKIQYTELPEPPSEPSGVGVNKKTYFVCNGIGDTWKELPDLNPKQIRVARQIYKSLTGNLEQDILAYPEFPGKEKHYLRAQIARISASTQIAPLGYYTFGGEMGGEGDEEDEELEEAAGGESKTAFRLNPKYEPPALKDLLDRSMAFWVHTGQYILPQGRTSWWNPSPVPDVDDEELGEELGEEEEEGDRGKETRMEPETGPPLLTPCSEDASLETTPAWSVRVSSQVMENYAIALVRSNLWPGAYCFSTQGKYFHNVYFGYGLKFMHQNFSPLPLSAVQQEYPVGPEILEILDPSGAEEEQWRIDHLPKPKPTAEEAGEEQEPEEAEEEEEEEEDD